MANYYEILGVPRNAGEKDIRQAFRKLAREHHPDVNPGDSNSEDRFKRINEAYSVLSDPDKRQRYDKYGDNWTHSEQIEEAQARARRGGQFRRSNVGAGDPFSGFESDNSSIFDQLFSHLQQDIRRSAPTEHPVEVTLEEAFQGTTRLLRLATGRRLEVKIPPGVDTGSRMRISDESQSQTELYLVVTVRDHPKFQRQGRDLYSQVEIPLEDAVLGGDVAVPTLRGQLSLTIPPETQNGQRFRLAGQGMPPLNNTSVTGDLYATVSVKLPTGLNDEERDLFRRLRDGRAGERR
jgi:DnaJ-class molecular chaperone